MLDAAYEEVEKGMREEYPCEIVRTTKYNHYYKDSPYSKIDVYRVLELFDVRHPCIQHAIKKLLVCGTRGTKDQNQDIKEAIDSLVRWQQMKQEEHGTYS